MYVYKMRIGEKNKLFRVYILSKPTHLVIDVYMRFSTGPTFVGLAQHKKINE